MPGTVHERAGNNGADEEHFVCKAHRNTSVVVLAAEEDAGELKRLAQETGG